MGFKILFSLVLCNFRTLCIMRVRILFPVEGISKYFNQKDGIVNIKVKITDSFFFFSNRKLIKNYG